MGYSCSIAMGSVALFLTILSVIFSIKAQGIEIRDSMDHFVADLHRQGWWAMWAAILQAVAVGILVFRLILTGDV